MAYDSVVRIFATTQEQDYDCPWQACAPDTSSGSGVIVGSRHVLTGAHVVADATFLQVRLQGDPVKFEARVCATCHDADLALIEVTDGRFAETAQAAAIGAMPELASKVSVVGFPVGGEEVSVTEGVVSRVEVQTYQHSGRRLLAVTVDAAINEGNSGGPVFQDGKVVGIAFQKLSGDTDNIGEMVPPQLLQRFLDDALVDTAAPHTKRVEVPGLGLRVQKLENKTLRQQLGLHDDEGGLLVLEVEHGGSCADVMQEGDVLLALDDHAIAGNGTITYAGKHRTQAVALLGERRVGDDVQLRVLRDGDRLETSMTLRPFCPLVPRRQYDVRPRFLLWGGLVLQPLSQDFLETWDDWRRRAPTSLLHVFKSGMRSAEQGEVVVLSRVLADESTAGYDDRGCDIVTAIDDVAPRDLAHVAELLDAAQGIVTVHTQRGRLAMDADVARARAKVMAERYQIALQRRLRADADA